MLINEAAILQNVQFSSEDRQILGKLYWRYIRSFYLAFSGKDQEPNKILRVHAVTHKMGNPIIFGTHPDLDICIPSFGLDFQMAMNIEATQATLSIHPNSQITVFENIEYTNILYSPTSAYAQGRQLNWKFGPRILKIGSTRHTDCRQAEHIFSCYCDENKTFVELKLISPQANIGDLVLISLQQNQRFYLAKNIFQDTTVGLDPRVQPPYFCIEICQELDTYKGNFTPPIHVSVQNVINEFAIDPVEPFPGMTFLI